MIPDIALPRKLGPRRLRRSGPVRRFVLQAIGWTLFVLGAIWTVAPIPLGFILVLVALTILSYHSRWAKMRRLAMRGRFPTVFAWVRGVEGWVLWKLGQIRRLPKPRIRRKRPADAAAEAPSPPEQRRDDA